MQHSMRRILAYCRAALALTLIALLGCGLLYSMVATGMAQLLFPNAANGSLIIQQQHVRGSYWVGQDIQSPHYFQGRPSASNYNVMTMSGSNLAQSDVNLTTQLSTRQQLWMQQTQRPATDIPADLITTSASGIDPHISVAAARLQLKGIATARHIPQAALEVLLVEHIEAPTWGLLGQARVNVLQLNLALDAYAAQHPSYAH
ncbi:potassium-transporting ATPase subunit C [Acinetobacter larvae]|uniref:Potassium-transporting ATPase KdpC subunit n=2 Tax=Acinetobacter larvae TaxID=1789224 RepID=A0A1B2LYZ5_9GAMM|nr:potassium-transporting ATPase subunit C [Acinetobacter larvae]